MNEDASDYRPVVLPSPKLFARLLALHRKAEEIGETITEPSEESHEE